MVQIHIDYAGDLRCRARHGPSGTELLTDPPVDNQGRGESFSPTDLVATALGIAACFMSAVSLLAIAAPGLWMGLFSSDPKVLAAGAAYLAIVGLAYPFVAGTLLNSAFQSTRQPQWPLTAMTCRLAVVLLGGWIAVELLQSGLIGIAVVTGLGLLTMGGVLIGAFRLFAKLG